MRRGSVVNCHVTRFDRLGWLVRTAEYVEVTGIEPVPVAFVDPGASSSGGGNSESPVLSLELESSEAVVDSVAACGLGRLDEPCWRLASCWSRRSTRTGLLHVVVKCADPRH